MKENNNIVIVLDALGEKIAALELELQCERYRTAELEKLVADREQQLTAARCRLATLMEDQMKKSEPACDAVEVE